MLEGMGGQRERKGWDGMLESRDRVQGREGVQGRGAGQGRGGVQGMEVV